MQRIIVIGTLALALAARWAWDQSTMLAVLSAHLRALLNF